MRKIRTLGLDLQQLGTGMAACAYGLMCVYKAIKTIREDA